jgi:hypothetical protein
MLSFGSLCGDGGAGAESSCTSGLNRDVRCGTKRGSCVSMEFECRVLSRCRDWVAMGLSSRRRGGVPSSYLRQS